MKIAVSILFFLYQLTLIGQSSDTTFLYCITSTIPENISKEQSDKALGVEKKYRSSNQSSVRSGLHTLPVVVHVVHNNGPENLSNAKIEQGITWLNEAFANMGNYNPNVGVDTGIQFCLAQQDQDNNLTNGINHVVSATLTNLSQETEDISLKTLIRWNTRDYINIWVVNEISYYDDLVAGYAYLPYFHGGSRDGIVVVASTFDSPARASTLIHEMGHYLGLAHTFTGGCKNDNCLQDGDRVCDTPPDNSTQQLFPCSFTFNTCTSDEDDLSSNNPFRPSYLGGLGDQNDMIENYMDYTDINCRSAFTEGQSDRMHFFIENIRSTLTESLGCSEPCSEVISASFSSVSDSIEAGSSLTFTNQSINGDQFTWYVEDSLYSTSYDFIHAFSEEGDFTITLIVNNSEEGCSSASFSMDVQVFCSLLSSFQYTFDGIDSVLGESTIIADSLSWKLTSPDGSAQIGGGSNFTGNVTVPGTYWMCLTVVEEFCTDTYCEYFTHYSIGEENCQNGLDDDGDDLVDIFDPDCPCNDSAYQAQCPSDCEILPGSFPDIQLRLKWQSEVFYNIDKTWYVPNIVCGDLDNDGDTEIITNYSEGNILGEATTGIRLLNGNTGDMESQFLYQEEPFQPYGIANVTGQVPGEPYSSIFCMADSFKNLKSYDYMGNELWSQPIDYDRDFFLHLADFNQDGTPELYSPTRILNAKTGIELVSIQEVAGCSPNCAFSFALAADVHPHPGLELVKGNKVFLLDIQNPSGNLGNTYTILESPDTVNDGVTAIADIDGDGQLDIITAAIATQQNTISVFVWNPRNQSLIAKGDASINNNIYESNGVPLIANIIGDCTPEILVNSQNEIKVFSYDGTSALNLIYSLTTSDPFGYTSITTHDLNNDGKVEIIYRDDTTLRIFDGPTGAELISFPIFSGTIFEGPIVADIDNDGAAEILVNGYMDENVPEYRVFCFESDGEPWAPARSVWNQYGYHVTNVNDDLTIPQYQQNQAAFFDTDSCLVETCPQVYNNFGVQATYRTQKGCKVYPQSDADLQITAEYTCVGDSIEICLYAIATDTAIIRQGVPVTCYSPPWTMTDVILDQVVITEDTTCITLALPDDIDSIMIVINDEGGFYPPTLPNTDIQECDYTNNTFALHIARESLILDLGPDIIRCATEPVVLTAQGSFTSYLWNDFSSDAIYTAGDDGIHYVETTDACGRVYRDTVTITSDTLTQISLSTANDIVCQGDSLLLETNLVSDSIVWYIDTTEIECDNCPSLKVALDTATTFYAVAIKDNCLSLDSINIQVKEPFRDSLSLMICAGDTSTIFNMELTEAGMYEYRDGDCDTIIQIELNVVPILVGELYDTICFGDTIVIENTPYFETDTYNIDHTANNGCDSILSLYLLVLDSIVTEDFIQLCPGDSAIIDGTAYFEDDTIEVINQSILGCDSLTIIDIAVVQEIQDTSYSTICAGDSIEISGFWEYEAGSYSVTFPTNGGCDSSHVVILSIITIDTTYFEDFVCLGDSINFHGEIYKSSGIYEATLTSQMGCDSVIVLDLQVDAITQSTIPLDFCQGDTFVTSIDTITNSGIFEERLTSSFGCDSLIIYDVTFAEAPEQISNYYMCDGDSVLLGDNYYFEPVTFSDTFVGDLCDTIITYHLEVFDTDAVYVEYTKNQNVPLLINNTKYDNEGEFQQILANENGCDSIIYISITEMKNDSYDIPNVFSPNGDNINDNWELDLSDYPTNSTKIYDRWGNLVAHWQNVNAISWNGTLNGKPLTDGVYIYIGQWTDSGGKMISKFGDITIIQ